jgi:hypothetical protein
LNICSAQYALPNVPSAFQTIKEKPEVIHLSKEKIDIPSGGHLQGIQSYSDSEFVITGSSGGIAYYLKAVVNNKARTGSIKSLETIARAPYRHAGGCQVYDQMLAVGVEDNIAKDKSDIMLIPLRAEKVDTTEPILISSRPRSNQRSIAHRSGTYKRSTAGATGFVRTKAGPYLVAVGDWDSRDIDFYQSGFNAQTLFYPLPSFYAPDSMKVCSYQSINLLPDTSGKVYLIGLGLDGTNNRADLYEVIFHTKDTELKLISSRNFKCKSGASFRYAAGIGAERDGTLRIYTSCRNAGAKTVMNIFK